MSAYKVILTNADGEHDVTTHYAMLWDLVVGSMDWGSGFLDLEEELRVIEAGALARFDISSVVPNRGFSSHEIDTVKLRESIAEQLKKYDQEDPTERNDG